MTHFDPVSHGLSSPSVCASKDTNALDALIAAGGVKPEEKAKAEPSKVEKLEPKPMKVEPVKAEAQAKEEDTEEEDPLMGAALKATKVKEEI